MLAAIRHRGRDAQGVHADSRLALGSGRLAIIDLSGGDHAACIRHVAGFPASDYYEGSAPTPGQQPTASLPAPAAQPQNGSHAHR
jgi:hypothetical protein